MRGSSLIGLLSDPEKIKEGFFELIAKNGLENGWISLIFAYAHICQKIDSNDIFGLSGSQVHTFYSKISFTDIIPLNGWFLADFFSNFCKNGSDMCICKNKRNLAIS